MSEAEHAGAQARESTPPKRNVRTIAFSSRPILEALRPGDEVVVVERNLDVAVFDREPTVEEFLRSTVALDVATLALVDASRVSGVLAMEGTWVQTKFVATVAEVLVVGSGVAPRDRIVAGDQIEFSVSGGETAVRGVVVRAVEVVDYPTPGRYLVTLGRRAHENGFSVVHMTPLLLEGQVFRAVPPSTNRMNGATIDQLRRPLRR